LYERHGHELVGVLEGGAKNGAASCARAARRDVALRADALVLRQEVTCFGGQRSTRAGRCSPESTLLAQASCGVARIVGACGRSGWLRSAAGTR